MVVNSIAIQIIKQSSSPSRRFILLEDVHVRVLKIVHTDIVKADPENNDDITRIMKTLGPTMGELMFRICRTSDGISTIEKKMDLSARSGKIVVKCALECLRRTLYADI